MSSVIVQSLYPLVISKCGELIICPRPNKDMLKLYCCHFMTGSELVSFGRVCAGFGCDKCISKSLLIGDV